MAETTFDTLATSENLQQCGLSEEQSKGIARAINGAIIGNVATKSDIESVRSEIKNLQQTTNSDIESLRSDIKSLQQTTNNDIKNLQQTTNSDIVALESRLKLWMFKALAGVAAAIVVVTKLLDYVLNSIPT